MQIWSFSIFQLPSGETDRVQKHMRFLPSNLIPVAPTLPSKNPKLQESLSFCVPPEDAWQTCLPSITLVTCICRGNYHMVLQLFAFNWLFPLKL